jgi:hypothetical protein
MVFLVMMIKVNESLPAQRDVKDQLTNLKQNVSFCQDGWSFAFLFFYAKMRKLKKIDTNSVF